MIHFKLFLSLECKHVRLQWGLRISSIEASKQKPHRATALTRRLNKVTEKIHPGKILSQEQREAERLPETEAKARKTVRGSSAIVRHSQFFFRSSYSSPQDGRQYYISLGMHRNPPPLPLSLPPCVSVTAWTVHPLMAVNQLKKDWSPVTAVSAVITFIQK